MFKKFDVNEELKKLYPKNGHIHITKHYEDVQINLVLEAMQKVGYEIIDIKHDRDMSLFRIIYR